MPTNIAVEQNKTAVQRAEQLFTRVRAMMHRRYDVGDRDRYGNAPAANHLAALDAVLPEAELLLEELKTLGQPASKIEIATNIGILVRCFPNAGSGDISFYAQMLCEDVAETGVPACDLELACRHVRHTSRFLPTISEVLAAIRTVDSPRARLAMGIKEMIGDRDRYVSVAEDERKRQEEEAKAECKTAGMGMSHAPPYDRPTGKS